MDYTALTTTLIFDNANDLQMIHIPILDDSVCEGQETFFVFLNSLSSGCDVIENVLTVMIWDDEAHFEGNYSF